LVWQEGDIPKARDLFESVLRIDQNHRYTLSTYPRLLEGLGDVESLRRASELLALNDSLKDQMIQPRAYDLDVYDNEDE